MLLLGGMTFVVALGYSASLPLLQLYLGQYLSPTTSSTFAWHVGVLGGAYTLALFLFAPWWGRLSDRHGRTCILTAGFATFLLGSAATALAPDLGSVYGSRLLAGAGAAAVVPTAQAYIADVSTPVVRSRRFVVLGSSAFVGFLAGPAFGNWIAGPVMGMPAGQMAGMVNWPTLAVVLGGLPLLLLVRWGLGPKQDALAQAPLQKTSPERRRFVNASMGLALLASFAVGTFEIGFALFGGQTLGLASGAMAAMFFTCSLAMLLAQSTLLLPGVRNHIDQRWVAAVFGASALVMTLIFAVPNAVALGLLIAVAATGIGMVGPVLSYELLERDEAAHGGLLGRQAAAGNLGQAIGSVSAGALFAWQPMAPFWAAAIALLVGVVVALASWGPARQAEIRANLRGIGDAH